MDIFWTEKVNIIPHKTEIFDITCYVEFIQFKENIASK